MAAKKKVATKSSLKPKSPPQPVALVVYKRSFMTVYHGDGSDECECEVRLSGGTIAVDYEEEDGSRTVYEGSEVGLGHFRLASSSVKGKATLHRFEGSDMLEGFWSQGGYVGMWRIQLNNDD
jgi:hypothetical protein